MNCKSCNKPMYVGLTTAVCDTPGCPEYVAPEGADTEPAPACEVAVSVTLGCYVDYQTEVWAGYWGVEIEPEDTTDTVREKIFKRAGVRLYGGVARGGKMQALETYSNTLDIVVDEASRMSSCAYYRSLRQRAERAIDEAILGKVAAPMERWWDPPQAQPPREFPAEDDVEWRSAPLKRGWTATVPGAKLTVYSRDKAADAPDGWRWEANGKGMRASGTAPTLAWAKWCAHDAAETQHWIRGQVKP